VIGRSIATIIRGDDKPLLWALGVLVVIGGALGGGLGYLVVPQAFVLALIVGAFLAAAVPVGPLALTCKTVAAIGVFAMVGAGLATLAIGHPWWSAAVLAGVAFVGALWTALPVIGQMAAGLPTLLVLLIVTRGKEVTGGQEWHGAVLAIACGLVGVLLLAVILHARDPRGATRQLVSQCWDPDSTLSSHGLAAEVLRLDNASPALFALLTQASIAKIARTLSIKAREPAPEDVVAAGDSAQREIEAALVPRGRLVPRSVTADTQPLVSAEGELSGAALLGTTDRRTAIEHGRDVLTGQRAVHRYRSAVPGLWTMLLRLSASPDAAVFRFGVQQAAGLGLGALILLLTDVFAESAFWILLTIFLVLQRNAVATWTRLLQRVAGTWLGALSAAIVALVVPQAVLVPWLAVVVLMVGMAYVQRNYTVMAASIAVAIVWFMGSSSQDFWLWAGLRALDTVIGAVLAYAISRLILPVRPQMAKRFDDVVAQLHGLCDTLRSVAAAGSPLRMGGHQIDVATAMSNYDSDADMLGEEKKGEATAAGQQLRDQWDRINSLALVVVHDPQEVEGRERILQDGFTLLDDRFATLAKSRPQL